MPRYRHYISAFSSRSIIVVLFRLFFHLHNHIRLSSLSQTYLDVVLPVPDIDNLVVLGANLEEEERLDKVVLGKGWKMLTTRKEESTGANEIIWWYWALGVSTKFYDMCRADVEMMMSMMLEGRGWVQKKHEYKASSSNPCSAQLSWNFIHADSHFQGFLISK